MDEFNYFAYVNDRNVVEQVITCDDPDKLRSIQQYQALGLSPGRWIQATEKTSHDTDARCLLWLGWLACCAQPWLGLAWACLACLSCLAWQDRQGKAMA